MMKCGFSYDSEVYKTWWRTRFFVCNPNGLWGVILNYLLASYFA